MVKEPCTVAILNSNKDLVEAMSLALTDEGFVVVTGHVPDFKRGEDNINKFLQMHTPIVALIDISFPFKENWNFFQTIKNLKAAKNMTFVVTTTNIKGFRKAAGLESEAQEILGKPYELDELIEKVRKACEK